MFFLFLKAKGNNRHPLCNPGLSKHFLKIKIKLALLKQKFLFPKNHDNFNLVTTVDLTKSKSNKIPLEESFTSSRCAEIWRLIPLR